MLKKISNIVARGIDYIFKVQHENSIKYKESSTLLEVIQLRYVKIMFDSIKSDFI